MTKTGKPRGPKRGENTRVSGPIMQAIKDAGAAGISSTELKRQFPDVAGHIKVLVNFLKKRYGFPVYSRLESRTARYWAAEEIAPPPEPPKPKREMTIAPYTRIRIVELGLLQRVRAALEAAAPQPVQRADLLKLGAPISVGRVIWRLRRSGACFAVGQHQHAYYAHERDLPRMQPRPVKTKPPKTPKPAKSIVAKTPPKKPANAAPQGEATNPRNVKPTVLPGFTGDRWQVKATPFFAALTPGSYLKSDSAVARAYA